MSRLLSLAFVLSIIAFPLKGQEISTHFGEPGQMGYAEHGTKMSDAEFNEPYQFVYNDEGDMIIVDRGNHRVYRYYPETDSIYVILGVESGVGSGAGHNDGTTAGSTQAFHPSGIVTYDGKYYLADKDNHVIREFEYLFFDPDHGGPSYQISTVAGDPENEGFEDGVDDEARFNSPSAMVVDDFGTIYIVDNGNQAIRSFDPATGEVSTIAGTGQAGYMDGEGQSAMFNEPRGIALGDDALYVSDQLNNMIRKIDLSSVDNDVTTYAGEMNTFLSNGTVDGPVTGHDTVIGRIYNPTGVAVDDDGIVYAVSSAGTIRYIKNDSLYTLAGEHEAFGTNDGVGNNARYGSSSSLSQGTISYDSEQNELNFIDVHNHTIRSITVDEAQGEVNSLRKTAEYRELSLKLYPNPAANSINLEPTAGDAVNEGVATIYTLQGSKIMEKEVSFRDGGSALDISDLDNGLYILGYRNDEDVFHQKFQIRK